jgi:hypothetical protein
VESRYIGLTCFRFPECANNETGAEERRLAASEIRCRELAAELEATQSLLKDALRRADYAEAETSWLRDHIRLNFAGMIFSRCTGSAGFPQTPQPQNYSWQPRLSRPEERRLTENSRTLSAVVRGPLLAPHSELSIPVSPKWISSSVSASVIESSNDAQIGVGPAGLE